ncbi:MAG: hypothetical protein IPJ65_27880 [Archangiaceae bacterium]|nr:hypothetical protein [Archangiaceae bacterium]
MRLAALALVLAYVMPPYSVLRRMAESRDDLGLSALKVEGTATAPAAAAPDYANALGVTAGQGELQLSAAVSMRLPGRCRVELSSLDSTRSVAAVTSNGKKRFDGAELPALQVAADEICAVLALHGAGDGDSRAAVERHLSGHKVDVRQASLGRFQGKLAYVIGDSKRGASQFWVFKDEKFHPARSIFSDDKGSWDVRFIDYDSQAIDWFPRVVEVWKGDALQLRMTTLNTDAKPKLDDKSF